MATTAQDNFTEASDTNIESHTPSPTGTSWTPATTGDTKVIGSTDSVQPRSGANECFVREGTDIGDDDMDVSADVVLNTTNSGHRAGIAGRYASGSHNNQYQAYAQGSAATTYDIFLFKNIAGVRTQLGTYALTVASTAEVVTLKLSILTATKKVFTNGTERISSSDDNLTGNNYAGLYGRNSSPRIDNFLSESVSASIQPPRSMHQFRQRAA